MFSNTLGLLLAIVFLGIINNILASKAIFKNENCTFKRNFFSSFTVKVVGKHKIDVDITLVRTLTAGLKGHMSFEARMSTSKTYQSVLEHDMDYCELLKGSQNAIYRRVFAAMAKLGNYSSNCPIRPGYYYMHGWQLNQDLLPSYLYLRDYRVTGSFYYGKRSKRIENQIVGCTIEMTLV